MRPFKGTGVFACLLAAFGLAACGGGSYGTNGGGEGGTQSASVFTIGTDAPLPSVVSCLVTVSGITLSNGSTNVSVLSSPQEVDFAQLSGLHQLIDLQSVPTGTYTSATVTLSAAQVGYIDTTQNPPTISTITGMLSPASATVTFSKPFVLQSADLVGLRMEFDLRKSIQVDSSGNVTGVVNPTFEMALRDAADAEVSIDDFDAGVTSVISPTMFTVQGPAGRTWTVQTAPTTAMDDPTIPENSFTTNTIVSLSGTLDHVSHYIDANEVEVVSNDRFVLGGLFTSIRPPSGPATAADLYVRRELPAVNGISDGDITTLMLDGSEVYRIGHINLPLTTLLFNNSMLAAGQRVDVGGKVVTANGTTTLTPHRVVLRRQGQEGSLHPNSVVIQSGNVGSFGLDDNGTAGVLLPSPLTVMTTNQTIFAGVSGLSGLTGTVPLRVVGYVLVNSQTGKAVLVATAVEELTAVS
ncbi:MAG: DUF4382 domain-containing protein [Candidatus Acidiferrales bacterium]